MKNMKKLAFSGAIAAMLLGGCAGMSHRDQNTAVGAGVGAIGGAAVGGIIGHEVR
jgi:osmotically inducible lipoprotein OsmB